VAPRSELPAPDNSAAFASIRERSRAIGSVETHAPEATEPSDVGDLDDV
jgi:hypothetical protein